MTMHNNIGFNSNVSEDYGDRN